ncbi:MAG: group I truncated hemoglobin [Parvibaculaceae bacterium]
MKFLLPLAAAGLSLVLFAAAPAQADATLYDDLGGQKGIALIADNATAAFLADPRIKDTFAESNMDRFKLKLAEQLCQVSDGPCTYTGHDMKKAHKGLHLKDADFNALVEDLQDALSKSGIGFATQNRLLARLAPMHRDVVTK